MQTRTCFNGGELSPEMGARCDLDVYMRGCRALENWELSQMGGVKRRRGMRDVCAALGADSRLAAYEYTHATASGVFLVELSTEVVRVLDGNGAVVALFESGAQGCTEFWLDLAEVRTCQLNAVFFITCRANWPLELRWDGEQAWSLKRVEFKNLPWRYDYEQREHPVRVTAKAGLLGVEYTVDFADDEEAGELPVLPGEDEDGDATPGEADSLRVSFYIDQAEAFSPGLQLRLPVKVVSGVVECKKNDRIAVHGDTTLRYWVCKKDFPKDVFVAGLDDPGCYPDNFAESENVSGFESVKEVSSVSELGTVAKGTKFAVRSGYWEYFTCIKDFSTSDIISTNKSFADYNGFFVRGIAVGDALPCKGTWTFYCSGLWYGSYEVRRSYEGESLDREWETAGVSFSRVSEAENVQLTGDESDEECWLRLFLTRSKYMTDKLADGFPPDSCGNRLIVDSFKHDMVLDLDVYGVWRCADKINIAWTGSRTVYDWSWAAISERYGYPLECDIYAQRLVFASTAAQPQSLWMSRTDDLFNFMTGDSDDSAIYLTLYTTSQNPVCWMLEDRGRLMLGTSNAEWVVQPRDGVVKPTGLEVSRHGRIGSMGGVMLPAEDKALYVGRGGGRVWEFGYSFEVDGCRSRDLTVFAPHILKDHGGCTCATLMSKPDTVGVFVLADGQVALMTYNTMHQVHAWHRWVTDGHVLSAAALPDGARGDRLFLIVERDGAVRIEVVDEDSPYVDADGREYTSTLITNTLHNTLEQPVGKLCKVPAMVLFGEPGCASAHLQVCADGGKWANFDRAPAVLQGWQKLLNYNSWAFDNAIGLRFNAPSECSILALQG